MTRPLHLLGQLAVIAAVFAGVAALADWPHYRQNPPNTGILVLTFVHGADRHAQCRRLTPEELAKLPINMRRVEDCPRRRLPIHVELDLDGHTLYRASLPPTGIAGDGPSRVFERFVLSAGPHDVAVRMRDTARTEGFDHARAGRISLAAEQMFVVDFRAESGEFIFR